MNLDRFRKACDRAWENMEMTSIHKKAVASVARMEKNRRKYPRFKELRNVMAGLLDNAAMSGKYMTLHQAYKKAEKAPPSNLRELILQEIERNRAMSTNDSNTYFKLFQSKKNKQWYFSIYGGNHRIIAQSEGYKRKESAEKAIATLKRETAAATVKE